MNEEPCHTVLVQEFQSTREIRQETLHRERVSLLWDWRTKFSEYSFLPGLRELKKKKKVSFKTSSKFFFFSFPSHNVRLPVHRRGKSPTLYDNFDSTIWRASRSFVFVKGPSIFSRSAPGTRAGPRGRALECIVWHVPLLWPSAAPYNVVWQFKRWHGQPHNISICSPPPRSMRNGTATFKTAPGIPTPVSTIFSWRPEFITYNLECKIKQLGEAKLCTSFRT